MVLRDFEDYANTHERLERDFRQPSLWYEKSIINIANSGFFSSDRSIEDYNKSIWNLKKIEF
jgi:starch phosphorylase